MEELWPAPSESAAALIRRISEALLADIDPLAAAMREPVLRALGSPAVTADPSLLTADGQVSRTELLEWLTSNMHRPGLRVAPYLGPDSIHYIRDLRRRGITPDFPAGWRAALTVMWHRWTTECLARTADATLLVELLDLSAQSLFQFAADSAAALREAGNGDLPAVAAAQVLATIERLLRGDPITMAQAENQLGYCLAGPHTTAVVWTDDIGAERDLAATAASVADLAGKGRSLIARASVTARWIWLPIDEVPPELELSARLRELGGVRVAFGRPGHGLDAFRSSHADAVAAQAVLTRLNSPRRLAHYSDLAMVDILTRDPASAEAFVTATLGPLAAAEPSLRRTLLVYIQSGCNTTRAAARLYAHRNSIERRIAKAEALATVKTADNPAQVAAALMILDLEDDIT